jgi:hypothetical protein
MSTHHTCPRRISTIRSRNQSSIADYLRSRLGITIFLSLLLSMGQMEGVGQTWTSRTTPGDNTETWNDIVYSSEKSLFVAVAASGINHVMTRKASSPAGTLSATTTGKSIQIDLKIHLNDRSDSIEFEDAKFI